MSPKQACTICGSFEPSHGHVQDGVVADYFTVGRGETDLEAALRWQARALKAEREQPDINAAFDRGYDAGFRLGQSVGQQPGQQPGQSEFASHFDPPLWKKSR